MLDAIKGFFKILFKLLLIGIVFIAVVYFSIKVDEKIAKDELKDKLYESEYFIYYYDEDKSYLDIIGLTDLGKEQEYLIIPEEIDGKKVLGVCRYYQGNTEGVKEKYGEGHELFRSDKLKRIYVNTVAYMDVERYSLAYAPSLEGFFYILNSKDNYSINDRTYLTSFYGRYRSANVSYFYNYENAINEGYYWIDNYNYGEKIEFIPPEPTREGYTFAGWYKESECINKWNFETDALPQAQYDESDKKIYQETKLYAKWVF